MERCRKYYHSLCDIWFLLFAIKKNRIYDFIGQCASYFVIIVIFRVWSCGLAAKYIRVYSPLIEIDVACLAFYIFWGFLFLNLFLLSQQHLMNLLLCRVYIRPATSTSWLHLFCRRQIVGFIKFLWWFLCFHFFGSYTHKHKLQFDGKLPGRLSESVR